MATQVLPIPGKPDNHAFDDNGQGRCKAFTGAVLCGRAEGDPMHDVPVESTVWQHSDVVPPQPMEDVVSQETPNDPNKPRPKVVAKKK